MMSPEPGITVAVLASRPTNGVGNSTRGGCPNGPDADTRLAEPSPSGLLHESLAGEQPTRTTAESAATSARATGRAVKRTGTSFDTVSLFAASPSVLSEGLGVTNGTAKSLFGLFAIADGPGCPGLDVEILELGFRAPLCLGWDDSG